MSSISLPQRTLWAEVFRKGSGFFQEKNFTSAIESFSKCLSYFKTNNLSSILWKEDDNDEKSIEIDRQVLELLLKVLYSIGIAEYQLSGSDKASEKEHINSAISYFFSFTRYFENIFLPLFVSEKIQLVTDKEALNLSLNDVKVNFLLAKIKQYLWNGLEGNEKISNLILLEDAAKSYSKSIELTFDIDDVVSDNKAVSDALSNIPNCYSGRGLCYNELRRYDKAAEDFTKQLELIKQDSKQDYQLFMIYHNRATAYSSNGLLEKALIDYDLSIQCFEKNQKITTDTKQKQMQLAKALDTFYHRGKTLQKLVQRAKAQYKIDKESVNMSEVENWKNLAMKDFEFILQYKPSHYHAHYHMAQVWIMMAEFKKDEKPSEQKGALTVWTCYERAALHLRKCIELNSELHKPHIDLARTLTKLEKKYSKTSNSDLEEIIDLYDKALQLIELSRQRMITSKSAKEDHISNKQLSHVYFEKGLLNNKLPYRITQSIKDFTKAIELNDSFADAYFNRGIIYYHKQKEIEKALQDFNKVLDLNPKDVESIVERALIYLELRKKDEATKEFEVVMKLDPNNATAARFLEFLKRNVSPTEEDYEGSTRENDEDEEEEEFVPTGYPKAGESYGLVSRISNFFKGDKTKREKRVYNYDDNIPKSLQQTTTTDSNAKFVDNSFPPKLTSILGNNGDPLNFTFPSHIDAHNLEKDIVWLRPCYCYDAKMGNYSNKTIYGMTNPSLFIQGASIDDSQQGALGNCWFISATCLVANHEFLIKKVVLEKKCDPVKGKYTFCFFKEAEWREITIDDYLPCDAKYGSLLFSRGRDVNELWISLIEKAYAKLFGNYIALKGGHIREALVDLTGGISFVVNVEDSEKENIWKQLSETSHKHTSMYGVNGSLKLLGVRSEKNNDKTGIVSYHAYAILDAFTVPQSVYPNQTGELRLVKLKNPWANQYEWKGDFSDNSSKWTNKLKEYVGMQESNDGIFYMSFEDFMNTWTLIEGVEIFDTLKFNEYTSSGEFDSNVRNDDDWTRDILEEKQYLIENNTDNNRIVLSLSQYDTRYTNDCKDEESCIALHLFRYDSKEFHGKNSSRLTKLTKQSVILQNEYKYDREIIVDMKLNKGHYVAVPHEYFTKNCTIPQAGSYFIRIFSQSKLNIYELSL
ncbi:hypothetical protein ABK040_002386 [Willaertia magna]